MGWKKAAAAGIGVALLTATACAPPAPARADLLLRNGLIFDGTGGRPFLGDIAIDGDRISFIGDGRGVEAETLDIEGLMVTPGFIDMHSHAELGLDYGRDALPFLFQGITTVLLGVDGGGDPEIARTFEGFREEGIGANAMLYVGHGEIRRRVMGLEDRRPSTAELDAMKQLVRQAMEEGALGLSTGLFYTPGAYAGTPEIIELASVAADYRGIYDTHDRDLGAAYRGIGYLASIREALRIGLESETRVIFSHFNAQGIHNYGRAPEGAALIEEFRAVGIEAVAAQHVYTATQSSLRAYAIPRWAAEGGQEAMLERFEDPEDRARLDVETPEMLAIRGGPGKILFADPRADLNGKNLAQVAEQWSLPVPQTVRRILRDGNAVVMNLDLYDIENTRYLAQKDWMMTCTDGRTPRPDQRITHPRVYGAFTRKLRQFVIDEKIITMPFAVRSMSGRAADFLRLQDRGYLKAGTVADIAVFDRDRIRDLATYQDPHHYSEGVVHLLINGRFAIRDSQALGVLAGKPLRRPEALVKE